MVISDELQFEDVLGLKYGYSLYGRPKMTVYIYFIDGLLIDTGLRKAQKQILQRTAELSINQIFITHHHEDHSGNINALKTQHQCNAYASPLCCEMMKDPPPISFAQKITWGERDPYFELIPKEEKIETENYTFQLIQIPGHAPDMLALHEPKNGWLFSADLYVNSYIGYMLASESISQQIESIRTVLELDFDVMFCCHNPKLKNGKSQLKKKLDFLESFYEEVAEYHGRGLTTKEIFKAMKLQENWYIKILSQDYLSKMHMVESVVRDLES